jgi:hypothetical protein
MADITRWDVSKPILPVQEAAVDRNHGERYQ